MTNYDKFMSRSVESLADYLSFVFGCIRCPMHDSCTRANKEIGTCKDNLIEWLNEQYLFDEE